MLRNFGWDSGKVQNYPRAVRGLWTAASLGPLQILDGSRGGVKPQEPRSSRTVNLKREGEQIPTPSYWAESRSPLSPYSPCGQHKHSSVLYSPPN